MAVVELPKGPLQHAAGRPDQQGARRSRLSLVPLLQLDPDLGEGLPPDAFEMAAAELQVPVFELRPGAWPVPQRSPEGVLSLLMLDGFLARCVEGERRGHLTIVGPRAPVDPWRAAAVATGATRWEALTPARIAVLGSRFLRGAERWPAVMRGLLRRSTDWSEHLLAMGVAGAQPRVDVRILTALWEMAQWWGEVTADGVVVPLPLTHARIGRIVGAERSTVSIALGELAASARLRRRPDDTWLLSFESRAVVELAVAPGGAITP
jgi:hypothetical protein